MGAPISAPGGLYGCLEGFSLARDQTAPDLGHSPRAEERGVWVLCGAAIDGI